MELLPLELVKIITEHPWDRRTISLVSKKFNVLKSKYKVIFDGKINGNEWACVEESVDYIIIVTSHWTFSRCKTDPMKSGFQWEHGKHRCSSYFINDGNVYQFRNIYLETYSADGGVKIILRIIGYDKETYFLPIAIDI
nr:hypothetical protein K-LCC10_0462 [Kaumoebavirus]